jgi:hypothetical protein
MRTSESGFRLGLGLLVERAERTIFWVIVAAGLGVIAMVGCHRNAAPTAANESASGAAANAGPDPAEANLAAVSGSAQVLGQSQQAPTSQSSQEYTQQQAAPIERQAPPDQGHGYQDQGYSDQDAEAGYAATLTDEQASAPPPPLPVYNQPEAPDPNDIWTPGYWAYAPAGYYWVPGAWCAPPYIGALWTPGYWGYYGGHYRFHHGFWGPHIGYYGGVNYGFGYVGVGYLGGYWAGSNFNYNRNFNRVGPNIRNVYVRDVTFNNVHYNSYAVNTRIGPRVSYNGGNGGVRATPRPAELAALREPRVAPMQSQVQAERESAQNRQQFYAANQGRPAIAAAPRPFAAERGIAPPARTTSDLVRPGVQPRPGQIENRPGQFAGRPAQIENRPAQPVVENRPGQPAPAAQPGRPMATRLGQPGTGNTQPPAPPRSEIHRVPQGQFQPRPAQPEPARPEPPRQPQTQPRPQESPSRPQPQPFARPQEPVRQPLAQPRPETQARPQPPEVRPQPQVRAEPRPQPQARPAPQARPQPQPRPEAQPHEDAHPKL